jgi:hypothetical protein
VRIHYLLDLIKLLPAATPAEAVPNGAGFRFTTTAGGSYLAGAATLLYPTIFNQNLREYQHLPRQARENIGKVL